MAAARGPDLAARSRTRPFMDERLPLAAGTPIGSYVIGEIASAGGFAIVYHAQDTRLERPVLMKEYFPAGLAFRTEAGGIAPLPSHDAIFRWGLAQWVTEARRLARIHHPSIAAILTYLEANGTAYTVIEALDGMTLEQMLRLRTAPMPESAILALLKPLLSAVDRMHAAGFVHRDIAADNIMVGDRGRPVLIDLFCACDIGSRHGDGEPAIVKEGCSPPEQYTSDRSRVGPWSDIYAIGALLYRMMTGERPPGAVDRTLEDRLVPIATRAAGAYSRELIAGTDAALRLLPAERPASIAVLRQILSGHGG
jgi:serine/threonine protein kinase